MCIRDRIKGVNPCTEEEEERPSDPKAPFASLAFKIMTDPFVGKLTYLRVYSGTLESGSYVSNACKDKKAVSYTHLDVYKRQFRIAVGQGKPRKAIIDYAEHNGVDLIVMGCRGLNAVAGMLGSVSYAVLRNASCPVLIEK